MAKQRKPNPFGMYFLPPTAVGTPGASTYSIYHYPTTPPPQSFPPPPVGRADDLDFDERMRSTPGELEYRSPDGVTFTVVLEQTGEVCLGLCLYVNGDSEGMSWCVVPSDEAVQFFEYVQEWMKQLKSEEHGSDDERRLADETS